MRTHSPNATKRFLSPKRLFWLLVVFSWALFLYWSWAPPAPDTVEHVYTRGVYRWVVAILTPVTQRVPFSIALVLMILLPVFFLALWVGNWIYRRRVLGLSHWRGLLWGGKWGIAVAGILLAWFLLFWGAGYQRLPVEKRLELDTAKVTEEEADELRGLLLALIRRDLPAPDDRDAGRALASVSKAMAATIEEWDRTPVTLPRRVKATPKGFLLANGTSGVCSPFTLEPHVDGGLPDTAFVSTGAHELGHIAGICSEAEANLISYVAGLRADDPYARYAVGLAMYIRLAARLEKDEHKAAFQQLPEEAREDLKKANEAAKRYRIDWFGKLSWRAYNHYLKSRGVKEGVKDYARGISLFTFLCRKGLAEVPIDTPAEAPAEPDAPEAPEEGAPPPEAPGPESAHGRAESS